MFLQPVACEGQIETWLSSFVSSLKGSLQFQMATALGYEKPKPKKRMIRSAGSRKVSVPARASSSLSKQNKGIALNFNLLIVQDDYCDVPYIPIGQNDGSQMENKQYLNLDFS